MGCYLVIFTEFDNIKYALSLGELKMLLIQSLSSR
jgi:hypothetical protein